MTHLEVTGGALRCVLMTQVPQLCMKRLSFKMQQKQNVVDPRLKTNRELRRFILHTELVVERLLHYVKYMHAAAFGYHIAVQEKLQPNLLYREAITKCISTEELETINSVRNRL